VLETVEIRGNYSNIFSENIKLETVQTSDGTQLEQKNCLNLPQCAAVFLEVYNFDVDCGCQPCIYKTTRIGKNSISQSQKQLPSKYSNSGFFKIKPEILLGK
jgi:hypothetical protein